MATKLTFHHLICEGGTSEIGDESPYFLTWVSNVIRNFQLTFASAVRGFLEHPEGRDGVVLVKK